MARAEATAAPGAEVTAGGDWQGLGTGVGTGLGSVQPRRAAGFASRTSQQESVTSEDILMGCRSLWLPSLLCWVLQTPGSTSELRHVERK